MKNKFKILLLLAFTGLIFSTSCNNQPKITKEQAEKKIASLDSQLNIIQTQWYDIYAKGVVKTAPEAALYIDSAKQFSHANKMEKIANCLKMADSLLNNFTPETVPDYPASTPLNNPSDLGNIHKATLKDLQLMEINGVPRWNYWFNFVGTGENGTQYMAYCYINHHGTGHLVPPTVFAYSTNKDSNVTKIKFQSLPKLTVSKDNITWIVKEDGKSMIYTLAEGAVSLKYTDGTISIECNLVNDYSFWYNKNVEYAIILPDSPMAGFEETGKGEGIFNLNGTPVKATGFCEQENLFCGGNKGADYRRALFKYGNEWWVPFYLGKVQGLFIMTGKYKDAGLFIDGKYIIPSNFEVTPIEANKSFIIKAKTSMGDLSVTFNMWGWDPKLYEHWGTCTGTFKGENLTNGYCWLEHIPQGGVNNSPPKGGRKGSAE